MNLREKDDESSIHQVKFSTGENSCNSIESKDALLTLILCLLWFKTFVIFITDFLGFATVKDMILQARINIINKVGSFEKCEKYMPWKLWSSMCQKN